MNCQKCRKPAVQLFSVCSGEKFISGRPPAFRSQVSSIFNLHLLPGPTRDILALTHRGWPPNPSIVHVYRYPPKFVHISWVWDLSSPIRSCYSRLQCLVHVSLRWVSVQPCRPGLFTLVVPVSLRWAPLAQIPGSNWPYLSMCTLVRPS